MLRFLTAGESHGRALVVIVEGLPAGLPIAVEQVQAELARRRLGYGRGPRMRFEQDEVTIVGGVRHGRTLGSPVAIEVGNSEWDRDPDKWQQEMSVRAEDGPTQAPLTQVRPGHADLAGMQKYGFTDARDVLERASARETAARVAAGTVAKALLAELDVDIVSHVIQMGAARSKAAARPGPADLPQVDESPVRCFDAAAEEEMVAEIKAAAKDGDSLGGVVEVLAYGVPVGLGSHVHWDRKLDALLARALMSIQAVKGVEIGDGFEVAGRRGSEAHDPITWDADVGRLPPRVRAGRRHRGRHVHRRGARRPGRDEAAGHAQPPDAAHRRHRHQGGDGVVQGAHRRHRGARHGRGGRDDGGARAGRRGHPQVRRRLGRRAAPQPRRLRRVARLTRMAARHVVLVGLMGSGKTTVGRRLAARLDRHFVDADAALEEIADRTVAEIFEQDGEAAFRDLEADTFEELLEHHEPCVIASGGGLVLRARRTAPGCVAPTSPWCSSTPAPAFLASRVEGKTHRPLLAAASRPCDVLTRLHAERAPLYAEVADITVDVEPFHATEEKPKQALAERIAELVVAHEAQVTA